MSAPSTPVTRTVAEGVARLSWEADENVDVIRRAVAQALTDHHRVEALVAPDDERGQRMATFSGMHREGLTRGITVDGAPADRIVYARVATDLPTQDPEGFRTLLNSFLPRKRAVGQMLIRQSDTTDADRILLCQMTYKSDWDLPGGVVEVNESPALAVAREVEEELSLTIPAGELLLTDWLPPWSGWDDALCLVFDGGEHPATLVEQVVPQAREIATAEFCTLDQVEERCADFTARRIRAALRRSGGAGAPYTESGREVG
ncbi:NUDIX domain-containing protein [Nocardioides sp.]|uniref:NUDIX hydrolase n=1 Tax=Nocardioides sp. TaxID=35761 RepID=UPI00263301B0|nr:NUDIX domain-containing protein [Nocardioides sp.]